MQEDILTVLKKILGDDAPAELSVPETASFGHYTTNVAMRLAKARGKAPLILAKEFTARVAAAAPVGLFEKVEAAAPGFINFWLSKETLQKELVRIAGEEKY